MLGGEVDSPERGTNLVTLVERSVCFPWHFTHYHHVRIDRFEGEPRSSVSVIVSEEWGTRTKGSRACVDRLTLTISRILNVWRGSYTVLSGDDLRRYVDVR